jgi:hypothetical protein
MSPDEAELLATRVEEARRTLLDPERRATYDASLSPHAEAVRAAANGPAGANGPAAASPFGGLPPVIPAIAPELPPPALPRPPAEGRPAERTSEQGDVPEEAPRPAPTPPPVVSRPGPIRLEREVALPPAPPVEIPLPEGAAWSGEALRRVREARGITIPQIAERTKVTRHHVENIEAERYSALPAPVYLRGILLSLARELRLDGQKVARAYLERAAAAGYGEAR